MRPRCIALLVIFGIWPLTNVQAFGAEADSYADIVSSVMPSVVNISVQGKGERVKVGGKGKDVSYATYLVEYVGAGSIVDSSGIIVTNKHVVNDAAEIDVTLHDNSTFRAQLLGMGVGNDLALLKIDAGHPLPPVKVGNSDELRLGDRVLAIGNPLGLNSSVSAGVISGLRRHINSGILAQNALGEFIQTDASINHGNSGGPLFNMKGEIVGVDNQIFSDTPGGGSIGIGFAIPSNDVKVLVEQIRQYGKPHLGWLGLRVQTVTPRMAEALKIADLSGAIIAAVAPSSPAAEAGLEVGDVVRAIDNEEVKDFRTLNRAAAFSIGQTMQLRIWHDGKIRIVPVTVKEYPQNTWVSFQNEQLKEPVFTKASDFGFELADLTKELRARFQLNNSVSGPVVTQVADNTAGAGANLRPGDVIVRLQPEDVHSKTQFEQRLQALYKSGQRNALVLVGGESSSRWITLPLRL
jgi:serine protease Do